MIGIHIATWLIAASSLFGLLTPTEALQRLVEGNHRFMTEQSEHENHSAERRISTVDSQEPFAIIVACSDSRVGPEIIFDQGLGDLFIVRIAGNVIGPLEQESINFAASVLKSRFILVLGHENCGAIKAVAGGQGNTIPGIAALIEPSTQATKGKSLETTTKANVQNSVTTLRANPLLKSLIEDHILAVQGGYYHFKSGRVELLP